MKEEQQSRSDDDPFPKAVKMLDTRDKLRDARAALLSAWEKSGEGALGPISTVISGLEAILDGKPLPWAIVTASEQQRWIPCSERLPTEEGDVAIAFPMRWQYCVTYVYFCDGEFGLYEDVTHWQPMPAAPKPGERSGE